MQQLLTSKAGHAERRRSWTELRKERRRDRDCRCVAEDTWIETADPVDASALLVQDLTARTLHELQANPVLHLARRDDVVAHG